MKKLMLVLVCFLVVGFTGCNRDADVASYNLSKQSDMFEIGRRVIFYNGITGNYILTIEGKCSIEVDGMDNQLEVTCKTGASEFKKHYLGLSDNVTYFIEQINPKNVSVYHYEVVFKPSVIIPDIDLKI